MRLVNSIDLDGSIFVICNSLLGVLARVFVAQLMFFDVLGNSGFASKIEIDKWNGRLSAILAALPGAQHLERCFAQRRMILHDS